MNIQTRFRALKYLYDCFDNLQISKTKKKHIDNLTSMIQSEMEEMESQALKDGINLQKYSLTGKFFLQYIIQDDFIYQLWQRYLDIKVEQHRQSFSSNIINCIYELENKYFTNIEWILPSSSLVIVNEQFKGIFGDPYIIEEFFKSNSLNSQTIDDLFINNLMTVDRINTTLKLWADNGNIQHRYPILKQALEAHNESNFFLSVSTLIPQVEGLIRDIIAENPTMNKISDRDGLLNTDINRSITSLEEIWKEEGINNIDNVLSQSPVSKMLKNLYKDDRGIPNNDGLYRKGICHGGITTFGTAKNSLKLILILDRLILLFMG